MGAVVEGWVVDFVVHDVHMHAVVVVVVIGLEVGAEGCIVDYQIVCVMVVHWVIMHRRCCYARRTVVHRVVIYQLWHDRHLLLSSRRRYVRHIVISYPSRSGNDNDVTNTSLYPAAAAFDVGNVDCVSANIESMISSFTNGCIVVCLEV